MPPWPGPGPYRVQLGYKRGGGLSRVWLRSGCRGLYFPPSPAPSRISTMYSGISRDIGARAARYEPCERVADDSWCCVSTASLRVQDHRRVSDAND